ncbi:MAG: hypothetical protein FWH14_01300 [Oscillospiraceae bacterium]|nr:hypothetical protein [Oscillospiraceae bacterium]
MQNTKEEISLVAKEVFALSLNCHFSDVKDACNEYLNGSGQRLRGKNIRKFNRANIGTYRELYGITDQNQDKAKREAFRENLEEQLKLASYERCKIYVQYLENVSERSARAVYNKKDRTNSIFDHSIIVYLPLYLLNEAKSKDQDVRKTAIDKIQKLMFHEFGHSLLHTDELYKATDTQGTFELKDIHEQEADWFRDGLLSLYNSD